MILNNSFDLKVRTIKFRGEEVNLYFATSLVKDSMIAYMIDGINEASGLTFKDCINNGDVQRQDDPKLQYYAVCSGCTLITYRDENYILETRMYPARSVEEPQTEKSVRGAKDGFTESILTCAGLIRRRIKTMDLHLELISIGGQNKIDTCLCYLDSKVDQKLLNEIKAELNAITNNQLVMSDRAVEELLFKQGYNPFPLVRYSERPDVVSTHILHGRIALICDTSSSVMMLPTSLFDLLEHVEEHRQTPLIGTSIRLLRYFSVFISVYLVPIWLAILSTKPESSFDEFIIQILILEVSVEVLRLATIHIPTAISNAMGVVAAILLGQFAIDLGVFSEEVLLFGALGNICGFATPNYELSLTNKYVKVVMILALYLFKLPGIIIFNIILWIYLARLKVFGYHYIYPLWPLNLKDLFNHIVRKPKPKQ